MNLIDKIFYDPITKAVKLLSKTGRMTSIPSGVITEMSDADATARGQKAYVHGTTYFGGNAPTITLTAGGGTLSTIQLGEFVPYQMQDGTWRMKFNIDAVVSSTSRTTATFTVAGIVYFNTVAGNGQAIFGQATVATSNNLGYCLAVPNTNNLTITHPAAVTSVEYTFSGDVKLASRPTWAY